MCLRRLISEMRRDERQKWFSLSVMYLDPTTHSSLFYCLCVCVCVCLCVCVRDRERERICGWKPIYHLEILFFFFFIFIFSCKSRTFLSLSLSLPLSLSLSLSSLSSLSLLSLSLSPSPCLSVCFFLLIILSPLPFDFHVLNSFNKVFLLFDFHFSYISFYLPLAAVLVYTCLLILSFSPIFSEFFISLTCWTQVSTYLETRSLIWTQLHWKKSKQ